MMNAISKKSRKNARKKTKMLTKIRNPTAPPGSAAEQVLDPQVAVHAAEHQREDGRADQDVDHHRGDAHRVLRGLPDQPAQRGDADRLRRAAPPGRRRRRRKAARGRGSNSASAAERERRRMTPIATSAIQPAMRARRENSLWCTTASPIAPMVPIAPASVGVARPRKIVPSTRKIRTSDGTMPHRHFFTSGQPCSVREALRDAGHPVRLEDADQEDVDAEEQDLHHARAPGAGVHVAHGAAERSASTIRTSEGE